MWGAIDPADDEDYFRLSVSRTTDYWIYTLGDLDTVGELLDSGGMSIDINDYERNVLPNPDNFFLWRKIESGTYYIKVTGYGPTDEPYILQDQGNHGHHVAKQRCHRESQRAQRAAPLTRRTTRTTSSWSFPQATEVAIRASGFPDTVGELQRRNGTVIASNDDGYLPARHKEFSHSGELRTPGCTTSR